MQSHKLFTKNFVLVMFGTIISAIGGIGLNVAMGVIVYEKTSSTTLFAIFTALSLIPQIVVPIIMGPVIDRNDPLKLLIKNESILVIIYFAFAFISYRYGFNYYAFTAFSIITSALGNISYLCSSSINPQIMIKENYIKGNAIMGIIYPLCNIFMVPLAFFLFDRFGITPILVAYGFLTIIDILIERNVDHVFSHRESKGFGIKEFVSDFKDGLDYFKNDTAIRNLFLYLFFSDVGSSVTILIYPFFANSTTFTTQDYAILESIRSVGYLIGGFFHFLYRFKKENHFKIAISVYMTFCVFNALMLKSPYTVMCVFVFVLGLAGSNSANIRLSAVAAHVPGDLRAKLNSFLIIFSSISSIISQLLFGFLAESIPIANIMMFAQIIPFLSIIVFLLPRKNKIRELYNYST